MKSIRQIQNFVNAAEIILKELPGDEKLTSALTKVLRRVTPCFSRYHDLLDDLKLDFVNTDSNGSILRTSDGEYAFTPAKAKEIKPKIHELMDHQAYEVDPVYITDAPIDKIPEHLVEDLKGFILK